VDAEPAPSTSAISGATAAESVTSSRRPKARPGASRSKTARLSSSRTVPMTRWPSAMAASLSARPKPLLTPVMNRSFDFSLGMSGPRGGGCDAVELSPRR
jgi:hypothetical protein